MAILWDSALFVLWASPVLYAVAVLFDNDFIGQRIYQSAWDGVVISTLVGGMLPLVYLLPAFERSEFETIPLLVLVIAILGALLYVGHLYYFFAVLLTKDDTGQAVNDGSALELTLSLNVVVVPICAWLLFGQSLNSTQWTGVLIILFAAIAMSGVRASRQTMRAGLLTTLFLAAYILCEEYVYEYVGIKTGFTLFAVVLVLTGALLIALRNTRPRNGLFRSRNLVRFAFAETVGIVAILVSHRALELNLVAYVVAVECFVPIMVALISLVPSGALLGMRSLVKIQSDQARSRITSLLAVLKTQRQDFVVKSISAVIMAAGTALLLV